MDSIERLGEQIGELSAKVDAATQRLLACIRQFDEAEGWHAQGAISCAHWLAWRIGLDTCTARERVRVARALGRLPLIDAAFGRGELSYAKVRAITRVATPEIEERLLEMARNGTGAQLERICRGLRHVRTNEALEAGQPLPPEDRTVRQRPLPGGMIRLEMTLSPDVAALVMLAVEKAREQLRAQQAPGDVSAETPRPPHAPAPGPFRADGVLHLATQFLCGAHPGETAADRYQVTVHLDQDALGPDGSWAATLEDGSRVSAETLRRIACDAALLPTLTDSARGDVLDIGRRSRAIPAAIRRALWVRDRGCRFPGCLHTRFLHGHHIQHWLHGGPTSLANLVLLCPRHHQLVHEGGFAIEVGADGALVFRSPRRNLLAANPARPLVEDAIVSLQEWVDERALEVTPDTNRPWWDGTTVDYDLSVSALLT